MNQPLRSPTVARRAPAAPARNGFSLIEILIVVAIIGILGAIAFPMYQDNTRKARMTEVVVAASTCRTAVSEVYLATVVPPSGWNCSQFPASKYVKSVATAEGGVITVTATGFGDSSIDDKVITFTPYHDDTTPKNPATAGHLGKAVYKWECQSPASGGIPAKYLPSTCRGA